MTGIRTEKLKFLDGIRALMALNVVVHHFVIMYYPQMYSMEFASGSIASLFVRTPLSIFVNGNIAVQYFFVLTGFLVGRMFFTGRPIDRQEIMQKSYRRYLRLLPVVVGANIFAYLTMILGLQHHLPVAARTANPEFVSQQCNFTPTVGMLLYDAVYAPFMGADLHFIGPLWTIYYELWGYILCMLAAYFLRDSKLRRIGYLVIALILWIKTDQNFLVMFMGLFVADLYYQKSAETTSLSRFYAPVLYSKAANAIWLLLGVYLAGCPMEFVGIYTLFSKIPRITTELVRATGVALVLFALLQMPKLTQVFERKWLQALGEISFGIYAFHWPVMLSVEAWLFDMLYDHMSYDSAAVLSFALTLPAILAVAYGSHQILENGILQRQLRKGKQGTH